MPTILIADDNSNIHKMVELALKDLGYKIEKVGNGEHAVRKLPDIKPDLILADIFMPVRNGYEVCEYVKTSEEYSHIPVVLLLGKFDPLDEHLMKKVRADGLLMKPFVPPDPLVKMVKTLLEESAAARAAIEAARAKPAISPEATVQLTPAEVHELTGKTEEPEGAGYAIAPPPVEIKEGDQTLAFGDLLGATGTEQREAPKTPEPGGFQASSLSGVEVEEPARAAETEEQARAEASWGGIKEELKQPTPDEPPIKVEFGEPEPMELVTDEPTATPSLASTGPLPELATSPDEWMQSGPPKVEVPPEAEESWEAAPPAVHEAAPPRAEIPVQAPPPPPEPMLEATLEAAPEPTVELAPEPAPLPYETPKLEALPAPAAQMDAVPAAIEPEPPPVVEEPPPPPAPVAVEPPPPPPPSPPRKEPTRAAMPIPMPIDLALVDAVVDKVMARLQPLILDQIRREVVRPLAEALLRKELGE